MRMGLCITVMLFRRYLGKRAQRSMMSAAEVVRLNKIFLIYFLSQYINAGNRSTYMLIMIYGLDTGS